MIWNDFKYTPCKAPYPDMKNKKDRLTVKAFVIFMFLPLVPLCADEQKIFIIETPEYSDESESGFIPENEKAFLDSYKKKIFQIFYHYSSGNASLSAGISDESEKKALTVRTVISLIELTESEKGGFFCKTSIRASLTPEPEKSSITMAYIGYGKNETEAFNNSVSKLPELLEYRYSDLEKKSGFFRILDIYQNEIIVSCGKRDGFSKGDFLEIINSSSGKSEGRIVLTDAEEEISFGRLLEWSEKTESQDSEKIFNSDQSDSPSVGSRVKKINYLGLQSSFSALYLADDIFSGNLFNLKLEYFRSLYVFHPFAAVSFLNSESDMNTYDLILYSAGVSMLRHFGKISLRSEAALSGGWYRDSGGTSDFKGGIVKGGIEYSAARHLGIFCEAGFMELFAENDADPDIGGFLFGGGLSFKY